MQQGGLLCLIHFPSMQCSSEFCLRGHVEHTIAKQNVCLELPFTLKNLTKFDFVILHFSPLLGSAAATPFLRAGALHPVAVISNMRLNMALISRRLEVRVIYPG